MSPSLSTPVYISVTLLYTLCLLPTGFSRSFTLKHDRFYLDEEPVRILAGEIHYHRIPPSLWLDRLERTRALGLNTVQLYVPWNFHEASPGEVDFHSAAKNLPKFLHMAQQLDLLAIVRIGPYICAEWDFGGLPAWLLSNGTMPFRTRTGSFLGHVRAFWRMHLLPMVKPMLIGNGGNVVMLQVENEFGSYTDVRRFEERRAYLEALVSVVREILGAGPVLFTTDGADADLAERGSLPGDEIYTVVDGCLDVGKALRAQKRMNGEGKSPFWCSEFYTGWLTHWSEKLQKRSSRALAAQISRLLETSNASISLYMAHGGTNFGFWAGANGQDSNYLPDITSYDYNAPIREDGSHGVGADGVDKFIAVQQALLPYTGMKIPASPPAPRLLSYGTVVTNASAGVLEHVALLSTRSVKSANLPPSLEAHPLQCFYGFALYSSKLPGNFMRAQLQFGLVRDRAMVMVDSKSKGVIVLGSPQKTINLSNETRNLVEANLDILVENMGRVNFGHGMDDARKGLLDDVRFDGRVIKDWRIHCLDFARPEIFEFLPWKRISLSEIPTLFRGLWDIKEPRDVADTYVNMKGWHKGVVWVNGHNLGRFWLDKSPQQTLYCPAPYLQAGTNTITVLELHPGAVASPSVELVDHPIWSTIESEQIDVETLVVQS